MGFGRRTMRRSAVLAGGTAVIACLTVLPARADAAPDVIIAQPVAISPDGTVLGVFILSNGGNLGGVWNRDGKLTYLPEPTGAQGENVFGINAQDEVVGIVFYAGGKSSAAEWSRTGKITILPSNGHALAAGINNCGEVVGYDGDGTNSWPVTWSPQGVETRLSLPADATFGQATVVNDSGTVGGQVYVPGEAFEPMLWRPDGQIVTLATPGQFNSGAVNGINASGETVGNVAIDMPGALEEPARWDADGNATILGGGEGNATGINDEGVAVGDATVNGVDGAVEWGRDGVPVALPIPPGTLAGLTQANAINDAGDVAGTAETTASDTVVVVWTPSGKIIDLATYPPIE